jgi:hypothetical protein
METISLNKTILVVSSGKAKKRALAAQTRLCADFYSCAWNGMNEILYIPCSMHLTSSGGIMNVNIHLFVDLCYSRIQLKMQIVQM